MCGLYMSYKCIIKNNYFLLIFDESIDQLNGVKMLSKIDLRTRYNLCKIEEDDIERMLIKVFLVTMNIW